MNFVSYRFKVILSNLENMRLKKGSVRGGNGRMSSLYTQSYGRKIDLDRFKYNHLDE